MRERERERGEREIHLYFKSPISPKINIKIYFVSNYDHALTLKEEYGIHHMISKHKIGPRQSATSANNG